MLNQFVLPDNLHEWKQTLMSLPIKCQDIYFTPENIQCYARGESSQVLCLTYQEGEQIWFFPGVLKPIRKIGKTSLPSGWFDFEATYGYGGPLSNSEDSDFLSRASQAFIDWAQNKGVIAQVVRFHPLLANQRWIKDDGLEILFSRYTMSVDLARYGQSPSFYKKSARNVISRARHLGIEARLLDVNREFPAFQALYLSTMERVGAEPFYFFDDLYFDRLRSLVKENGFIIGAFHQGQMNAAALFLYGNSWLHYHFSASDYDNRLPGATNLILDKAFQEAKSKRLRRVFMGGGSSAEEEDSLLKFKQSMSTDTHPFYLGTRIYNPTVYKDLVAIWRQEFPALVPRYQTRLLSYRYER